MNAKFIIFFMLICILLFTILSFSCGDDDDEDDDDPDNWEIDDDEDLECIDTHQPELLSVALIVNNIETQMPTTVYTSDTVAIAFEYSDEDCNFTKEGDQTRVSLTVADSDVHNFLKTHDEYTPSDFPDVRVNIPDAHECSSEQMGGPYILEFDPSIFLHPVEFERESPYHFVIRDSCEKADINLTDIDFTVVEG